MFVFPEVFDPMFFSIPQHVVSVKLTTNEDPEVPGLHKSEAVGCSENVSV